MPFKKEGNKQILIFILFLFISMMFWFLQSLNNKEDLNISLQLEYKNLPNDVILAENPPTTVNVQLRDKGMNLINYSIGRVDPIEIDLSLYPPKKEKVVLTRDKLIPIVSEGLKSSTQLISMYSDSIVLVYASKQGVKLPVKLNSDITISNNSIKKDNVIISPSSVTVYADSSILSTIKEIESELLVLEGLSDTTTVKVRLKERYGVKIEPQEVNVTIPVEELISKKISLPIMQKHLPKNTSIITFPTNAEIEVKVPMSKFIETDKSKFELNVDYRDCNQATQKLPVELSKMPEYIESISITPDSVEYIIERREESHNVVADSLSN